MTLTTTDIPFLADNAITVTETVLRDYFDDRPDPMTIAIDSDRITHLLDIALDYLHHIRSVNVD